MSVMLLWLRPAIDSCRIENVDGGRARSYPSLIIADAGYRSAAVLRTGLEFRGEKMDAQARHLSQGYMLTVAWVL